MTIFTDAQQAQGFVLAQGRNIESRIYERRYPDLNYQAAVPVVIEGNQWANGTQFFTLDTSGEAKVISGGGADVPLINSLAGTGTRDFWMIGAGWEWTLEDINQAALYSVDLTNTKPNNADRAVERKLYNTAMVGEAVKGATGFTNDAGVDVSPAGLAWDTPATADQMVADCNDALSLVSSSTNEVEFADSIALPPEAIRLMATTYRSTDNDKSALDHLRESNVYTALTGQPLNIIPVRALRSAGAAGVGRMVAYRRDLDVLRFHLPMPKLFVDPRQKSLMAYEAGIVARTGGLEVRLPGAMKYVDGILSAL